MSKEKLGMSNNDLERLGGSARFAMGGPALEMWKPCHVERIVSMHPSKMLRERKNGRATTKVARTRKEKP